MQIRIDGKKAQCNRHNGKKPMITRFKNVREQLLKSHDNQNRIWIDPSRIKTENTQYNFMDLFSGCGGISCGFEMANFKLKFSCEIDKDASATMKRNFPETIHHDGPVQDIDPKDVQSSVGSEIHVLCAGFPCQGFSIAGARDPKDERNELFNEVIRFAEKIKPWFVVCENVPGIATMEDGIFLKRIKSEFNRIGYPNMTMLILDAAEFGVAQIRPRAIFIANRFDLKNPYPRPQLKEDEFTPIESAINDLKDHPRDPSINHEWTRHSEKTIERISKVKPGESLYKSYHDAFKRQYKGVPSMTIKENHGGTHIHPDLNRVISAREMARLQSFPDSYIFEGRMKRVMWQVGNAVPPLLAKNVALAVRHGLDKISAKNK